MVYLANHIIECIWSFIHAFLGAVYLTFILLVCVAAIALLHRFIIAKQEGYSERCMLIIFKNRELLTLTV